MELKGLLNLRWNSSTTRSGVSKPLRSKGGVMKERVSAAFAYVEPTTPAAFGAMIRREADLWERVARPLKIELN